MVWLTNYPREKVNWSPTVDLNKNELRAHYEKEHLWTKVTKQLKKEGKLVPRY